MYRGDRVITVYWGDRVITVYRGDSVNTVYWGDSVNTVYRGDRVNIVYSATGSFPSLPRLGGLPTLIWVRVCLFFGGLLYVPATYYCTSVTDLHRQFYVLPH